MNGELLSVLDFMEREKGIDKEILIKAVESSLVSATRKSCEAIAKQKHISVHIDRETGNIKAFTELTVIEKGAKATPDEISITDAKKIQKGAKAGDKISVEITTKEFGRIAAQTAKQVIIQKIREAERDLVYNEFKDRVGDITMGVIRHKERGNVTVDLGRAEAILPPKEQSPEERYRIGDRIRAYVVDVKAGPKGPEIVLSRTHIGLIKRLFELEVPEIDEGIVEIKGISREPGVRTKIAVHSKDPKVDPIGACVGMRGSRVKNVVRELEPEKLDIIKWESDIKQYVTNALSPAKLEKVMVNEKERKLEVLVAEDQLSVSIGKRGQNVRLASKLTGWNIDIRKIGEGSAESPKTEQTDTVEPEEKKEPEPQAQPKELASKLELSKAKVNILIEAGFNNLEKIAGADLKELAKLKGFGGKTVAKIKAKAQEVQGAEN